MTRNPPNASATHKCFSCGPASGRLPQAVRSSGHAGDAMTYDELRYWAGEADLWLSLGINLWLLATALALGAMRWLKRTPLTLNQAVRTAAEMAAGILAGLGLAIFVSWLKGTA